MSDQIILYIIDGYQKEITNYIKRIIITEAENRELREQLHQEQLNSTATIQGLNDEIASLQQRFEELQNRSDSENT